MVNQQLASARSQLEAKKSELNLAQQNVVFVTDLLAVIFLQMIAQMVIAQ